MAARRPWGWLGFFVVLTGLSVIAVVLPIWYNVGQQLRQEQLDEARMRWREKGPADYDLTFSVYQDRDRQPIRHVVVVRNRQVVFAVREGEPVQMPAAFGLPLAGAGKEPGFTVPLVLDRLQALLDEEGSERRNLLVAAFDPVLGYPRRYVHRVRGTSTREEWTMKVWKPGELDAEARKYR